ncbi:MAG TPA: MarR family transcriptional regulator [Candidatus Krumholzibacteria bacterium]|nr:MarR family transcriptional regulator [Candidatus Krumholzibacteria bacterium]
MTTQTATPTADAALERDTRDLYEALTDLVRVYQFRDRNCICCHDISVTQCYALDALVRAGSLSLGSLASTLMLDKSTTSRVVDALDRKGYVKRTVHPDDARVVRLTATIRGRNLHQTIRRDLLNEERAVIESLPAEVRRATVGVVRELAKVAAKRIGRVAPCCGDDACET